MIAQGLGRDTKQTRFQSPVSLGITSSGRIIVSKSRVKSSLCCFTTLLILLAPTRWANRFAESRTPSHPALLLGTAWYPEQWPESRWETDLSLMQQAGIRVVRVGEFAWSRMESEEGHYDLD